MDASSFRFGMELAAREIDLMGPGKTKLHFTGAHPSRDMQEASYVRQASKVLKAEGDELLGALPSALGPLHSHSCWDTFLKEAPRARAAKFLPP